MAGTFKFAKRMGPDAFNLLREPEAVPVPQKKPQARQSTSRLHTGPLSPPPPLETLYGQPRAFRSDSTYSYTGTLAFTEPPPDSDDLLSALAHTNGSAPRTGPLPLGPRPEQNNNSKGPGGATGAAVDGPQPQMESISASVGAQRSVSMFLSSAGKSVPSSNRTPNPEKQQPSTAPVSLEQRTPVAITRASALTPAPAGAPAPRLPSLVSVQAFLLGRIPCAIEAAVCAMPSAVDTVLALVDRLQIEGQVKIRAEDAPLATLTLNDECVSIVRKDFVGGEERIPVDELVSTFTFRAPPPPPSRSAATPPRASAGVHLALLALNAEHARLQAASPSRAPDGPLCDCLVFLLSDAQAANALVKAITAQFSRQ